MEKLPDVRYLGICIFIPDYEDNGMVGGDVFVGFRHTCCI
jgi:hypothetical protein